ncbi:MAG: FkbM family methyltransferase [Sphingobacteriia bacterium]|nr:FkbM family methyltransferase [Candidatus Fonsibacter lacus]
MVFIKKHLNRLHRSLAKKWRELMLPRGFLRLGTRYGGWWVNSKNISEDPFLIDCGLGKDISFPKAFLDRFSGRVIGLDPDPESISFCNETLPKNMALRQQAFWIEAGKILEFNLARSKDKLPKGADGSGSLIKSHAYVIGSKKIKIKTTSLMDILTSENKEYCDILKLDIEGAEYEVIDDLCNSGNIKLVNQLLVEFHHGVTHYSISDTEKAILVLKSKGLELVHVEGRNHIFIRRLL